MAKLSAHHSHEATKMLFLGEPGSGKTGSLASLVNEGYNLGIIDADNGLDALVHALGDKTTYPNGDLERVHFVTVTDKLINQGGKVIPKGTPKGWQTAVKFLTKWDDGEENLGPIEEWGPDWVLVLDSLGVLSMQALRFILALNGRSGQAPWQSDWGEAMRLVEDLLMMLYSDSIKCNVIVTSHITYHESEENGNIIRGLPRALGSKLPPKVGGYFNTVVQAKTRTLGKSEKHVILTKSSGLVELKNAAFNSLPAELPLETGLATIFKTLQGKS